MQNIRLYFKRVPDHVKIDDIIGWFWDDSSKSVVFGVGKAPDKLRSRPSLPPLPKPIYHP